MLLLSYIIHLVSTLSLSLSLHIQPELKKLYIRGGNLTTLDKGKFGKLVAANFMFGVFIIATLLLSYMFQLSLSLQSQQELKKLYVRGGNLTTLDKGKFGKLVGADFMFEVLE